MAGSNVDQIQLRFGDAVRSRRRELGISQEELAERAGLDRTYIGSVERGERNIGIQNLYRIAKALGCSPGSLVSTEAE